jgi:NADPH-dependent 2,4-dienoyl-CoA reductase/sulfur reductase-like enzyme/nitrite reductase/ring-hydroxylating ferredoxin subunit
MNTETSLPDFAQGVSCAEVNPQCPLLGMLDNEHILLIQRGAFYYACKARCPHAGAPLTPHCVRGNRIVCPWHHAEFQVETGICRSWPAYSGLNKYHVVKKDDRLYVQPWPAEEKVPENIVVVGSGAAAMAAIHTARKLGYRQSIRVLTKESLPFYDRTKLSKVLLQKEALDKMSSLFSLEGLELHRQTHVARLDPAKRTVECEQDTYSYDALLLCTGAKAKAVAIPGSALPHVFYLRTLKDANALQRACLTQQPVVIVGGGWIALEVASHLVQQRCAVTIVSHQQWPLERQLGQNFGRWLHQQHQAQGIKWLAGAEVLEIRPDAVVLQDGQAVAAKTVLIAVGAAVDVDLAASAGIAHTEQGIVVDSHQQTSIPGIYAAGDNTVCYGAHGQIEHHEHWVSAQQQGEVAMHTLLQQPAPAPKGVPFFWSQQGRIKLRCSGRLKGWDICHPFSTGEAASMAHAWLYTVQGSICGIVSTCMDMLHLDIVENLMGSDIERAAPLIQHMLNSWL